MDPAAYNGGQLVAAAAAFLPLTWVSVMLRGFVRIKLTKSFHADDWLMLASQLLFTVSCSLLLRGVHYGIGRHDSTLPQDRKVTSRMFESLATLAYVLAVLLIKLSVAVFLYRIAVERVYKAILSVSMVIVGLFTFAIFLYETFRCNPVQAQWDATIPHKCVTGKSFAAASYALSVMAILSDWLYALIPIPMIWGIQMTRQAKLTVSLVLGLGIFASIATLVRLKYLIEITNLSDILFSGTNSLVWSIIEPGLAITGASLATIRPLLRALNITGFKSSNNRSAEYNPHSHPNSRPNASLRNGGNSSNIISSTGSARRGRKTGGVGVAMRELGTGGRGAERGEEEVRSDASSEEYILQGIGVTRTVDVRIEEADSNTHEMGRVSRDEDLERGRSWDENRDGRVHGI